MVKQRYIQILSTLLLVFYIVAGVEQSVAMLLCDCHHHNEQCCEHRLCEHSVSVEYKAACDCSHDHSAEIELYVDMRDVSELLARQLLQLACVNDGYQPIDIDPTYKTVAYQLYIPPLVVGGEAAVRSLRAPPVLA